MDIPDDHPRAESLRVRHAIIEGMHAKIVAEAGLIAHGRGEAFDYLIGEKTNDFAIAAIDAAAAHLTLASHPVLSLNGNVTALCAKEIVELSNTTKIPLEINLFYRSEERITAIVEALKQFNPEQLLGSDLEYHEYIQEISSARRIVDTRGIGAADVVFVPLEDGDRTIGLKQNDKVVITVDLNPLSRTAQTADVTIVDNIIRVMPLLRNSLKMMNIDKANSVLAKYDNKVTIQHAMQVITSNFKA